VEGLGIMILKDRIVLDKNDIIPLKKGIISSKHLARDGKTIPALFEALRKELKKSSFIAGKNSSFQFKGTIIVQADKTIPFKTLKKIMYTTGTAGYADFKFAVVSDE